MLGSQKLRVFTIWMGATFWAVLTYRLERSAYLVFGKYWRFLRVPILPFVNLISALSRIELPYTADIGGGVLICHPALGIHISPNVIIGSDLTLIGGNFIGKRKRDFLPGKFVIGNNCTLGAQASVLGPIRLADGIFVGAMSCVMYDCLESKTTLFGNPARVIRKEPGTSMNPYSNIEVDG